jgi:hypothetical protein
MFRQMATLRKRLSAAWLRTQKWFFTRVSSKMSRQLGALCKRFSAAWLRTHNKFFTRVPLKMSRQIATLCKSLPTSGLSTRKWFFTRMPSEMANQRCRRRKIFATTWPGTSMSLRLLSFLLLLAHTRANVRAIAGCILYILIFITVASLAFLRWYLVCFGLHL